MKQRGPPTTAMSLSDQAAHLAITVLDTIPPEALRGTTRRRLISLNRTLSAHAQPGRITRDLCERVRAFPVHHPTSAIRQAGRPTLGATQNSNIKN